MNFELYNYIVLELTGRTFETSIGYHDAQISGLLVASLFPMQMAVFKREAHSEFCFNAKAAAVG